MKKESKKIAQGWHNLKPDNFNVNEVLNKHFTDTGATRMPAFVQLVVQQNPQEGGSSGSSSSSGPSKSKPTTEPDDLWEALFEVSIEDKTEPPTKRLRTKTTMQ